MFFTNYELFWDQSYWIGFSNYKIFCVYEGKLLNCQNISY